MKNITQFAFSHYETNLYLYTTTINKPTIFLKMKDNKLLELFKDIPDGNPCYINIPEANSPITIYNGIYSLKTEQKEYQFDGKIVFEWVPNFGTYFYGNPELRDNEIYRFVDGGTYSIIVNGIEFGQGFIVNTSIGVPERYFIKGVISQSAILGDTSIPTEKIRFSVPNLTEFHGISIKNITEEGGIHSSKGRLSLEDDLYMITIDKCVDFKERRESLSEKGGYMLLYNGELVRKKGAITHAESKDIFYCLNTFLTFLNGRKTSALFLQGVYEDEDVWSDYSCYTVDSFETAHTWIQRLSIEGINDLWKSFRNIWNNSDNKSFLTYLIHWYVESNGNTRFSEGSIILAQTALELVYNWWIVENKKMILGRDSENISASNKIRLLISQLNITSQVPKAFNKLQEFVNSTDTVNDAPDAIVYIRNAIVHSQEEKRKKLSAIHYMAIYEALQVFIWYIELSLLCILDYQGKYSNRCSESKIQSHSEVLVPWKK